MVQCLNFLEKTMSIKQKIKFKQGYRGRGTSSAELRSTGPKLRPEEGSVESSALDGESIRRDVPDNDNVFNDKTVSDEYKSGGAYKAIMQMFADQLEDKKFADHCKKFFKGNNDNT